MTVSLTRGGSFRISSSVPDGIILGEKGDSEMSRTAARLIVRGARGDPRPDSRCREDEAGWCG
jgi:hypothetical protein